MYLCWQTVQPTRASFYEMPYLDQIASRALGQAEGNTTELGQARVPEAKTTHTWWKNEQNKPMNRHDLRLAVFATASSRTKLQLNKAGRTAYVPTGLWLSRDFACEEQESGASATIAESSILSLENNDFCETAWSQEAGRKKQKARKRIAWL